jgi:sensor domain CHASE-containing protein
MKLHAKVMALLVALFAVLAVAQFAVERRLLLPSFGTLERQAAHQDMDRVVRVIEREVQTLSVVSRDWGNWVETWDFLRDRDLHYVTANLTEAEIASLQINALAIYDTEGRLALALGRDSATHRPISIDILSDRGLPQNHALGEAIRRGKHASGFLSTDRGPMLFVLSPVLDGHEQGPARGMVLMGKLITDAAIASIGEQAKVRLTRVSAPAAALRAGDDHEALVERESVTEIYRDFPDIDGARAFSLRIDVPRVISASGRKVVRYASASIVGIGALVLVLGLWLLHRSVLDPLARITRHMTTIGGTDDLSARLNLRRKDELGDLAREFDRMVGSLDDARRRLLDRSYEAGVAQNASGVLHNLGNAMTPLCVNISALQELLRGVPTADIETALRELEQHTTDGERRAALLEFLQLASRELLNSVAAAQQRLDTVAHGSALIQSVVAAQRSESRSAPLLEPVQLPVFLMDSATLVSAELRERLALQIDPGVGAIGEVWLARTALQQVVQNLIVNAAEAVRDPGGRGTLRISARTMSGAEGEMLELTFADDGVGIAEDNLGLVFSRGFSTKPRATNSGIGLHWCANTVIALGGRLAVGSGGPMRGASFLLTLPLRRAAGSAMHKVA